MTTSAQRDPGGGQNCEGGAGAKGTNAVLNLYLDIKMISGHKVHDGVYKYTLYRRMA